MSIDYTGGHGKYKPPIGSNLPGDTAAPVEVDQFTYADDKRLRDLLDVLFDETKSFRRALENKLVNYALWVDRDDAVLGKANTAEWPDALGDPSNKISYRYYKALQVRNTASAAYIRRQFEDAARDVTGTNALDFLAIVRMTLDEAYRIQGFLNEYVGQVDDSSEHRSLELFQDWVEESIGYTRQFRRFFEEEEERQPLFSEGEIASIDASEAKQGQAVFKVKLNTANDKIVRDLDFLYKNFAEYGAVFYKRFLGPAMTFRLNVSRNSLPVSNNEITDTITNTSADMDKNLRAVLADQLRRNVAYTTKMKSLYNGIEERDRYRSFIRQLAAKGKPVKSAGTGVVVEDYVETEEEIKELDAMFRTQVVVWDERTQTWMHPDEYRDRYGVDPPQDDWEFEVPFDEAPFEGFEGNHASLTGLEDDDHPQYLLRSGGHLIGDVTLDPGVRIDGLDPSTHAHTGLDGSGKIRGTDIIGGTLPPDVVDTGQKPPKPSNFRLVSYTQVIVPPGVTAFNAHLAWEGDESLYYEIQHTFLGSSEVEVSVLEPTPTPGESSDGSYLDDYEREY